MEGRFVAYYRVSTERQGRSGLGLDAQREAVLRYLNGGKWDLVGEFTEHESGATNARPQLAEALKLAKRRKATLIVAKLDRLTRDVRFLLEIVDTGVALRFLDFPDLDIRGDVGRMMLTVMGSVAEFERRRLTARTKAALEAKKARGEALGNVENLRPHLEARRASTAAHDDRIRPIVDSLAKSGATQRAIADALTQAGIPTPQGSSTWGLIQVQRAMKRMGITTARAGAEKAA